MLNLGHSLNIHLPRSLMACCRNPYFNNYKRSAITFMCKELNNEVFHFARDCTVCFKLSVSVKPKPYPEPHSNSNLNNKFIKQVSEGV